jgi:glucose/arabinose dehydrogenase
MNKLSYLISYKNLLSHFIFKNILLLFFLGIGFSSSAQPSGFQDQLKVQGNIINGLFSTVGVTFDKAGKMYAYEASGKVWAIRFDANNVERRYLMLDISDEVLNNGDLGLVSMTLDPDFLMNGYVYLMYAVNRQFLIDGTNGGDDATQSGSIVRVTRYTADVNANPSFSVIDVNSRMVLLGTTASEGIPVLGPNHGGGCLIFGNDGTLLVSTGDGSTTANDKGSQGYFQEAIDAGVIPESQNVGSYRSQMDSSLNGKVLRINPTNGDAIASNPLYSASSPRSATSRMWAKGLRNPFRMTLFPNTGGHHPEDGNPGIILIGDVGSSNREEINTVTAPAQNFGWPHYEGIDVENFSFDSLLFVPATYRKPIFEYRDSETAANVFLNQTTKLQLGTNVGQFPYSDTVAFTGNTMIMGEFYQGTTYPSQYQNALFFADFNAKWIRVMKFDANYEPASIEKFMQLNDFVVGTAYNPIDESMYYVTGLALPCDQIRKLVYSPSNVPPIAKIQMDTDHGIAPLPVSFSAIKSYDPDDSPLTYEWTIDDNTVYSTGLSPHFVFTPSGNTPQNYKVKLKVTDLSGSGLSSSDSITIYANNTPPVISSTSIDGLNFMTANQNYFVNLSAVVSDAQTATNDLLLSWTVAFAHNGHEHKDPPLIGNNVNATLSATACEVGTATYWYKIYLKVTDLQGLSTTYVKEVQIDCPGNIQTLSFPTIPPQEVTLNVSTNVTTSANTSAGVTPLSFFVVNGPATVSGNILTLIGKPGKVKIKSTQHGNNTYKPTLPLEQTFEVDRTTIHYNINFNAIPDKRVGDAPFALSATISPTSETPNYLVISGPVSISGNTVTLTGGTGLVRIRAYYEGNYTNRGAYSDQIFYINNLVTTDNIIYGDALATNWQNVSTITSLNIANNVYPFINTNSIKVTNPTVDQSLILSYNGFPIDTSGYKDGIEFWVYNENSTTFPFQVQAFSTNSGGGGAILGLSAEANKWSHFLLDWSILGNLTQLGKISFKLNQTQSQSLYFDEIKLVHCSNMYSVQTGNWNQTTTWSCGRIPISTDDITVSGGHTVTIPNGVSATLNFLQLIGTLNVQTGAIFDIKNY